MNQGTRADRIAAGLRRRLRCSQVWLVLGVIHMFHDITNGRHAS